MKTAAIPEIIFHRNAWATRDRRKTRTVDMHIAKLRAKIPRRGALVTLHRHGYMSVKAA